MSETKVFSIFCSQCCQNKEVFLDRKKAQIKLDMMNDEDKETRFILNNKELIITTITNSPHLVRMIMPLFKRELEDMSYTERYTLLENTIA